MLQKACKIDKNIFKKQLSSLCLKISAKYIYSQQRYMRYLEKTTTREKNQPHSGEWEKAEQLNILYLQKCTNSFSKQDGIELQIANLSFPF